MIECARLKSSTRQDHGRIAAHLSKQARNDNQAAYPLIVFVDGCRPTLLRLIGPPAALSFVRDSSPPISPTIAEHIYSQDFLSRRTSVAANFRCCAGFTEHPMPAVIAGLDAAQRTRLAQSGTTAVSIGVTFAWGLSNAE
jgi:hypothetical protein